VKHLLGCDILIDMLMNSRNFCRIGRTGRAGKKGTAISFFVMEKNARLAKDLVEILRRTNQNVPPELQGGFNTSFSTGGGFKGKGGGGRW
jgi:ATP-dependent RNA helicase DDX5/DBP2